VTIIWAFLGIDVYDGGYSAFDQTNNGRHSDRLAIENAPDERELTSNGAPRAAELPGDRLGRLALHPQDRHAAQHIIAHPAVTGRDGGDSGRGPPPGTGRGGGGRVASV
jgi:hypothetical protein